MERRTHPFGVSEPAEFSWVSFSASGLLTKVNDKHETQAELGERIPVKCKQVTSVCCGDEFGSEQLFLNASSSRHGVVFREETQKEA